MTVDRFTFRGRGMTVRRVGYGAMQFAGPGVWGPPKDRAVALAVLRAAVDAGVVVDETEFDAIFGRIRNESLDIWADPLHRRPGEINHNDSGRGVYFTDPDGHDIEVITKPYAGLP